MFDTAEEANQKLRHSVVLLSKEPVFIQIADGNKKNLQLHFNKLGESTVEQKNIWEKDWNFRDLGPHLGYSNIDLGPGHHKEAIYLSRMPVRQCSSTQGLSSKNIYIPPMKGSSKLGLGLLQLSWQSVYSMKSFAEMLKDKYPSKEDASKHFEKDQWLISKAFSREFAVRRADVGPFYLQYKGKDVGHSDDLYRFKIAKQYQYLQETMEHLNLRVA